MSNEIGSPSAAIGRPITQPWDGTIHWTSKPATEGDPRAFLRSSGHGLVYTPKANDRNVYRTICLSGLPSTTDLRSLIAAIRGGSIYSAHLMNMEQLAGFQMGFVTFVEEKAARAYVDFAAKCGVYFDNQRAKVVLFQTPTFPTSTLTRSCVPLTRCIIIKGPSNYDRYSYVAKYIEGRMPVYFALGDIMVENDTATELQVRFHSIPAAQQAMPLLRSFKSLEDCTVQYTPDPCNQRFPRYDDDE